MNRLRYFDIPKLVCSEEGKCSEPTYNTVQCKMARPSVCVSILLIFIFENGVIRKLVDVMSRLGTVYIYIEI